jgi:triosephosphate isomerase
MIAGNWKMNKTTAEATELVQQLAYEYQRAYDAVDVVICPPFTDLRSARVVLGFEKTAIKLGAQDVYWEDSGAFTGAISPLMLKELGCSYCIVGHSERREFFAETDEAVNKKARALLKADLTPVICCGESLACYEAGDTVAFVAAQIAAALDGMSAADAARAVVAYEPIWAIGTGRTATPDQAETVCGAIRGKIADLLGGDVAAQTRILYGGSMKPENAAQFVPLPNVDGGLIGGASLVAASFIDLVKAFA